MKFDFKAFFKKNWQHFAVLGLFIVITFIYFSPAFTGHTLNQTDIQNYIGMSRETTEYKENGEHIGWTNSMFSGMPTEQISGDVSGNWTRWIGHVFSLGLPYITWAFIISMVTMYILLQTFRLKPFISAIGSIAYALTSYMIIIIKVGHTSKSFAMAYIPLVIAGFYILYRRNWKLGILVSMVAMTLELAVNHVQITYYLAIIMVFLGIVELINAIKEKRIKEFSIRTGMLVGAYIVALIVNFSLLFGTLDYTKYSTRGKSELTITPNDKENDKTDGLDRSYIVDWSYGIQETWTLIIPEAKGGKSELLLKDKDLVKGIDSKFKGGNFPVQNNVRYWGDQGYVEGPVYVGVIVVFLFILGMIYVKDKMKWGILAAVILGMMLSWGGNFPGLTDFFIDNAPLYNKFRAVSMTLVILEFCLPFLALLFIKELYEKPDEIKNNPKGFYIASGVMGLIFLAFMITPDSFLDFQSKKEVEQFENFVKQVNDPANPTFSQYNEAQKQEIIRQFSESRAELTNVRIGIFRSDTGRSFAFLLLAAGLLYLFIFRGIRNQMLVIGGLGLLITIDLFTVDQRYLNNEKEGKNYKEWVKKLDLQYPFYAEPAEQTILQQEVSQNPKLQEAFAAEDAKIAEFKKENELKENEIGKYRAYRYFRVLNKNTHFRVHDFSSGFSSGRSSYFHKTIGGYHGAKLKRYNEVWNFYFQPDSKYLNNYTGMKVLSMLNAKYFMQKPSRDEPRVAQANPAALGNAWLVNSVKYVDTPDDEILALGDSIWDPRTMAIVNSKYSNAIGGEQFSGVGNVTLETYHPTRMVYKFNSQEDQLVVFSEVYYPENWTLTVDGQETEIICANYILRGAKVPAGEHEIVMTYNNPKTAQYNTISKVGSGMFYAVLFGMIFLLFKDSKNNPAETKNKEESKEDGE